jgi:hypothetical protein
MMSIGKFIMEIAAAGTLALTGATLAMAAPASIAVTIDGQATGFVKKFSGLAMEADIVASDLSSAPVRALVGADMGAAWSSWLTASSTQGFAQHDLTTVAPGDSTRTLTFHDALITSVTIPKLDGSSKDAAYFDIEVTPERISSTKGPASAPKAAAPGKTWLASNFRFEMAGLPCSRITSVDSFTWRQEFARDPQGKFIKPAKVGDSMKPTVLRFSIDAADAPAWTAWYKQFLGSPVTKSGALQIFDADMKSNMTVELKNVAIVAVKAGEAEANSEKIARFNVELYVEKMAFKLNYSDAK